MLAFFRFLNGYLLIRISGFSPERFMNLCRSHRILLWNISPKGESYEMNVSLYDFYRIKPLIKKTKTKVHIIKREGFPFLLVKWKKRKLFLAGFAFCFIALFYFSTFIWAIDIQGNTKLTKEMLFEFLEENDVTYGKRKSEIDIDTLEKSIRNEYPFITWTSAKIDGTKLIIYVKENDITTGMKDFEPENADLVASTDGVVESIVTRSGVPMVKKGDVVKAGDVLISGAIPIESDEKIIVKYQFCRADGDVWIKSNKVYQDTLHLNYETKQYTGKQKHTYSITVLNNTLQFFSKPKEGLHSFVASDMQLKLLQDFYLPFHFEKKTYSEYVIEKKVYSKKEATSILNKNLRRFCEDLDEKGVQILEKNVKMMSGPKQASMQGVLTVLEKADEFATIQITTENAESTGETVSE